MRSKQENPLFSGLNALPWSELTHAYGTAEEVPMWLRQLASSDEEVRVSALNHLHGSICHQGWICPATAYAVPFLVRLLGTPALLGKAPIVELLTDIARAYPELAAERWRTNAKVPQWNVPASIPFQDARQEVGKGIPTYVALLTDPDPTVRVQIAYLLLCVEKEHPEVRGHLREALAQEADEALQANLVLALGRLSHAEDEEKRLFREQTQGSGLIAFCASLMVARLERLETPQELIPRFVDVLFNPPEELAAYETLPCRTASLWRDAALALGLVGAERLTFLLPELPARISQTEKWRAMTLTELFLFIYLSGNAEPEALTQSLQEGHQPLLFALLSIVCSRRELWSDIFCPSLPDLLAKYHLPNTIKDLALLLGQEVPPPLSRPTFSTRQENQYQEPPVWKIFQKALPAYFPDLQAHRFQMSSATNLIIVNDRWVFRVPRAQAEIVSLERETTLLLALHERMPLPLPYPQMVRTDLREPGHAFMGYARLAGKPLVKELWESIESEAVARQCLEQILAFLAALHHFPSEEVADLHLPLRQSREESEALYTRVREALFPQMTREECEQTAVLFEHFLDTASNFAMVPTLVHGNFGPACILYDAKACALSGIIDFDQAGLGDPASDFERLLGPRGYGLNTLQACAAHYPGLAELLERAHFYAQTALLRDQLKKLERQGL